MNGALVYLWLALLRRRAVHFGHSLRRPTTLIGVGAVAGLLGVMFWFRHEEFFGRLVERKNLGGLALLMACASVFKGFLQRGLAFEPADVEFIFTSPFTERQIVGYRLLPQYLYAVVQGLVFAALFAPHLEHPWVIGAGVTLFQVICFHLATGAAIFAGTLPEAVHHRIRWMMLGSFAFFILLFLRFAYDIRFFPNFAAATLMQVLFYPAATLSDAANAPALHRWALKLAPGGLAAFKGWGRGALYLGGLAVGAGLSLKWLLKLKGNLFEVSLATTARVAERRLRRRQGCEPAAVAEGSIRSARLPKLGSFGGVGALVWRNLMVARRSRRTLAAALVLALLCAWGIGALSHEVYKQAPADYGGRAVVVARQFNLGIGSFLAFMAFLWQRMFPFDFRRDGDHLAGFRTLPVGPVSLVLAEIAVPVVLVLGCQAVGLAPLLIFGRVEWTVLLLLVLTFPAIALALSLVWNIHYVVAATRRAGEHGQGTTAVGTLMVVAFSFLVFAPAMWAMSYLSRKAGLEQFVGEAENVFFGGPFGRSGFPLAAGGALGVQYVVDLLLVLLLARLFGRFEEVRDSG